MAIDFYKHRHIPKISSAIALIAFLMPFFLVKCGNTVIDEIHGYELLTGKSDIGQSQDPESTKDVRPDVFAFLGIAAAIALVALAWIKVKNKKMIQLIIAIVGFLSLVLLFVNIKGTDVGDVDSYGTVITIELSYGYYTSQLGFLFSTIFHALELQNDKKNQAISNERIVDDDAI